MHTYSINEARKIALNCAKQYDKNLNGKNYIIIYRERTSNHIKNIEVKFDTDNYQHLTGIEMIDSYGNIRKNVADLFYSKCIKNTLRKDEIRFKNDGTTNLKLRALPILMNIQKITANQSQVLAIFSKEKSENTYTTIRYVTKGVNLHKINLPCDMSKKISLENYIAK